jgi:hypothetical protein
MAVTAVDGLTLMAGGQPYVIAGVLPPSTKEKQDRLTQFLRVATAQGIEIEAATSLPNGHSIRCEPRIWHWCGNDPVAAHFEQYNLNELIIALRYAEIAPEIRVLDTPAALRLRAAERYAHQFVRDPEPSISDLSLEHGIDVSAIMSLHPGLQLMAHQISKEAAHP